MLELQELVKALAPLGIILFGSRVFVHDHDVGVSTSAGVRSVKIDDVGVVYRHVLGFECVPDPLVKMHVHILIQTARYRELGATLYDFLQ